MAGGGNTGVGDTLGALTPTKGTIAVGDGTKWNVLAKGSNDQGIIYDDTEATGLKAADIPGSTSTYTALWSTGFPGTPSGGDKVKFGDVDLGYIYNGSAWEAESGGPHWKMIRHLEAAEALRSMSLNKAWAGATSPDAWQSEHTNGTWSVERGQRKAVFSGTYNMYGNQNFGVALDKNKCVLIGCITGGNIAQHMHFGFDAADRAAGSGDPSDAVMVRFDWQTPANTKIVKWVSAVFTALDALTDRYYPSFNAASIPDQTYGTIFALVWDGANDRARVYLQHGNEEPTLVAEQTSMTDWENMRSFFCRFSSTSGRDAYVPNPMLCFVNA